MGDELIRINDFSDKISKLQKNNYKERLWDNFRVTPWFPSIGVRPSRCPNGVRLFKWLTEVLVQLGAESQKSGT